MELCVCCNLLTLTYYLCILWIQYKYIPNQDVETGDLEAESIRIEVNIAVGLFVAAIYDNAWHVGKITDIDEADEECLVTF
jgi:hypothetical protein